MATDEGERKLAAILSADVVGYSKLMADDERATVNTLKEYRLAIARVIERHKGRVVNAPGDNILAEFASAVEAVQSAAEIQKVLEGRNLELPAERRMEFRIGVNLGDVIAEEDGTIYGDGVNVAARMEALAEAGGICISSKVLDEVEGKLDFGFDFLGEQQVKNITKPVRVYRVRAEPGAAETVAPKAASKGSGRMIGIAAPSQETVAETVAESEDSVLALPTGPSIAVLPFDNLSGDSEQEYFVDGLTEQIITGLTRFESLFVIARNSTFRYKGQSVDVREVGRDLGVSYVLEGSVRKAGGTIRVTAQLLDAGTGGHLWAEDYERTLSADNIFALQDDIAEQVIGVLGGMHGVIARSRMSQVAATPTDNLDAYECVLRAQAYINAYTKELHLAARECLERAVEIAPDYVDAWANLALLYTDEYWSGFNPRPDGEPPLELALTIAQKALELDPDNVDALFALSRLHYFRHELPEFYAMGERAISLSPNDATRLAWYGQNVVYTGRWERGKALLDKARALNPYLPTMFYYSYANYYYHYEDYEAALDAALKINQPGLYWSHIIFSEIYGQMGRIEEAKQSVSELLRLYPSFNLDIAADEMRIWNFTESHIEHRVDGLRKAGVPDAQP
jgi:adenylate cyclase